MNILPEEENTIKHHKKTNYWFWIISILIFVFVVTLTIFFSSVVFSDNGLIKNIGKLDIIGQVGGLMGSGGRQLNGENNDRVNGIIIGMGGADHDGGTLADTMILVSYKPSTKQVAMMSIPRDMWVKYNGSFMKVNAVNAYAERAKKGSGGAETAKFFSNLLKTDINYYATVDFDGFEKVIDEFGGVDVDVERELLDYQYPIRGKEDIYPIENRFEVLDIKPGMQHMNGELALKYARSRHAMGVEGSDFARSRRQQKVMVALKEKIMTAGTLFNPTRINSLLTAYNEHVTTNLQAWEMLRGATIAKDIDTTKVISRSLTNGSNALLYADSLNGAYVLLPRTDNFDEIASAWNTIFDGPNDSLQNSTSTKDRFAVPMKIHPKATTTATSTATSTASTTEEDLFASSTPDTTVTTAKPKIPATTTPPKATTTKPVVKTYKTEQAKIEIQNGTKINGWASSEKTALLAKGFNIITAKNAVKQDYTKIYIYNLTKDNPLTISELQKVYGVKATSGAPAGISSSADILIILGKTQ